MPETSQIVHLYEDQISIKFYSKKHQYFRRINKYPVIYFDGEKEIQSPLEPSSAGSDLSNETWVKLTSTTGITSSALDKPFLYNWLVDVTAKEFKKRMKAGVTLDEAESKAKGARWKAMRKGGNIGTETHQWINEFILFLMEKGDKPSILGLTADAKRCIEGFLEWYDKYVEQPLHTELIVYHPGLDIVGTLDLIFKNKEGELEIVDFKTGNSINPGDVMQLAFYRKTFALQHKKMPDVATIVHLHKDGTKATPLRSLDHDANMIAFECGHYLVSWRDTLSI